MAQSLTIRRKPLPLPPAQARLRRQAKRRRRLGRGLRWLEGGLALAGIAWIGLMCHVWLTPLPQAWFAKGTLSLRLLDRDGHPLHEQPAANGRFGSWLPSDKLPSALKRMTLAAEDHRITQHPGVDPWAVLRAIVGNALPWGRRSGASTLAMQLARLLKPARRTYPNKLREMVWALILQERLGPDGVLREYLNRAPYGNRVQGVQRASLLYFDRPAADLGLGQAAFLAALPWGPGILNPFRPKGKRLAWARAQRILHRAHDLGMVSTKELHEALQDPIVIQRPPRRANSTIHLTQRISQAWTREVKQNACAPGQKQRCREALTKRLNEITTTIDLPLQRKVQNLLRKQRLSLRGAGVGAAVVLDHRNGEVLAYVGSHDYFDPTNHGAIDYLQVARAPGSTLKPLVYAKAIQDHGYTGASLLEDLAATFLWRKGAYIPRNHDARFLGPMRLRVALGNSRNIPVLRVLSHIGVDPTLTYLRSMGLYQLKREGQYYGLGLALGSAEVSLLSLARAYAILAREGKPVTLRWAKRATDSLGRVAKTKGALRHLLLPEMKERPSISGPTAQIIAHILADPIARLPSFGRHGLMEFPFPVAVKTGTSQGHRDAWMLAFSDRIVVGCWIGNHDRRKMGNVYGTKGCGPIVQKAMRMAMARTDPQTPAQPINPPRSWKRHTICALSGQIASPTCPRTTEEWLPTHSHDAGSSCPFHRTIQIDRRNGYLATPACPAVFKSNRMAVALPPLYDSWVKAMGLPTIPNKISPLCPAPVARRDKRQTLQIKRPTHLSRFVLDPTIPAAYATLSLQVLSSRKFDTLDWFANGKKIGSAPWPYAFRWPMRRGRYHFVAATKDGSLRSQPVTIDVQ